MTVVRAARVQCARPVQPPVALAGGQEHAGRFRVVDRVDQVPARPDDVPERSAEEGRDARHEVLGPDQLDAQGAAHRAPRAVGHHQVARSDRPHRSRAHVAQRGADAVRVHPHTRQFGAE